MSKLQQMHDLAVLDDLLLCTYTEAEVTWEEDGDGTAKPSADGISYDRCGPGKVFHDVEELKKSLAAEKKFKCTQCDYSTPLKPNLEKHSRTHLKIKPYACSYCGKLFAQTSNRTRHEKTHQNIKDHKCSVCNKAFAEKCNLVEHLRIHTGEKPFKCALCKHASTRKRDLQKHIRKVHTKYLCKSATVTILVPE